MNRFLKSILLIIALAGITIALDADPSQLLWRDFITDEGWWTAEARDRMLFNTWVLDEYNQGLTVPLASFGWLGAFRLFGVSLFSARLPSAIAGLLAVMLLGLMVRRRNRQTVIIVDRLPVDVVMLLLATAIPFVMFARIAMPEMLSLICLLGAWFLLDINQPADPAAPVADRISPLRTLAAGILFGAAISAKLSTIIALPFLAHLACLGRQRPTARLATARWRPAIHLSFAAVLTWAALRMPFGLRFPAEMQALDVMHRGENLPDSLIDLLANISFFPWPSPFLYQVTPLLVLAGYGAWQIGLRRSGRGSAAQALSFLLFTGLTQSIFSNPADRRFIIFLPAIVLLAARGWRALARDEDVAPYSPPEIVGGWSGWLYGMIAALSVSILIPGRVALWVARGLAAFGRPLDDFQIRALAGLLFVGTTILALLYIGRRHVRASRVLRVSLVVNWLYLVIEPFDFLIWAGLGNILGRYNGSILWPSVGRWWAIPWGLLSLSLVWLILARAQIIRRIRFMERHRMSLLYLTPVLGLLVLAPTWIRPVFSMRDAATTICADMDDNTVPVVVGKEAPTLIIGSGLQAVPIRGEHNRAWRDLPPPRTRMLRLMMDNGIIHETEWPAEADTLDICPGADGAPRFRFAVWDTP
ncbi:MAG: hypothetical protein GY835_27025 [bacterium]|nr:hypothetical protein [bacterium]